jgi:hypothetical protein
MKFGIAAQYMANGHISNAVELKKRQVIFATFVNNEHIFYYIQCGNFNWNKIYNLDIGNFCKKNPETGRFLFFLAHIWRIWFLRICCRKFATTPNFFFSNRRVCQVTFRLKGYLARNTMHSLFPEYFQKIKTHFIS